MNPYVSATIAAIEAFRDALRNAAEQTRVTLADVVNEYHRVKAQVESARDEAVRIQEQRRDHAVRVGATLTQCEATVYVNPETGEAMKPDCSGLRMAFEQAQQSLHEAEKAVTTILRSLATIQSEMDNFSNSARRLQSTLSTQIPAGSSFLSERVRRMSELPGVGGGGSVEKERGTGFDPNPERRY